MMKLPWSYSSLSCFEKCPAQYKFRYIDKIPEGPSSEALVRGRRLHTELDLYMRGTDTEIPPCGLPFKQELEELRARRAVPEQRWDFDDEWKFVHQKSWVVAITDVHYVDGKLGVVIDYKSGKYYDTHIDQAKLYGVALLSKEPKIQTARVEFFYLDKVDIVDMEIDRDEAQEIKQNFEARASVIALAEEFEPRPTKFCKWCSYAKSAGGPCTKG